MIDFEIESGKIIDKNLINFYFLNIMFNCNNRILLIGAGQLGSRYLQGISKSNLNLEIIVSDPSRFNKTCKKKTR